MKNYLLFIVFSLLVSRGFAQSNLRVFAEKQGDITVLYADNNEVCAVSVLLTLELENLFADESPDHVYIVPARTQRFRLVQLSRNERGRLKYKYNYSAMYGNVRQTSYDMGHVYDLPFNKGTSIKIEQGYNGTFTHRNENSLDFQMREGTQVRAARGGIVIAVVQRFNEYCWTDACKEMANYVLIYHTDGTIGDYHHLMYNGARVMIGDTVRQGQLIALSGNTGYTRGPHLHFDCYLPGFDGKRTLMTRFRTGAGKNAVFLKAGSVYKKGY